MDGGRGRTGQAAQDYHAGTGQLAAYLRRIAVQHALTWKEAALWAGALVTATRAELLALAMVVGARAAGRTAVKAIVEAISRCRGANERARHKKRWLGQTGEALLSKFDGARQIDYHTFFLR